MRRSAIAICVCAVTMAASAGSASAATIAPSTANFGNQGVGGTSAPRAFTLTPDLLDLTLSISTTGDYRQTNNCPAILSILTGPCTINVTFAPTAAGNRSGTLSSTTLILGGPTAQLAGTGTAGPDGGKGAGTRKAACKKKKGKKKRGKKGATAAKKKKGKKRKCGKRKKRGKRKK
jgi:hypothetical protein